MCRMDFFQNKNTVCCTIIRETWVLFCPKRGWWDEWETSILKLIHLYKMSLVIPCPGFVQECWKSTPIHNPVSATFWFIGWTLPMIVPSLAHLPLASITRFSWAGDAFGKWITHDAIPFRSCNKKAAGQFFFRKNNSHQGWRYKPLILRWEQEWQLKPTFQN